MLPDFGLDYAAIRDEARSLLPSLKQWRGDLKALPETGLKLPLTSGYIQSVFKEMGLPVKAGYAGGYGLITSIEGEGGKGPTVVLRADMDALPMAKDQGAKHMCGHDGHMAVALGAAKLLTSYKQFFKGTIRLLFQPGEEGPGGARLMVEEGALEKADTALALHLDPGYPLGSIALRAGQHNTFYDTFKAEFFGPGGHGAYPDLTNDPILASAYYLVAIQHLVSRNIAPSEAVVVSVGKIHSGEAPNIIPDQALLEGSIRCLEKCTREKIQSRLKEIGSGVAKQCGVEFQIEINSGYPPVINDPGVTVFCTKILGDLFGENVFKIERPLMGSDDFSFIARRVPSLMYRLGCAFPEGRTFPLHSPQFDFPDETLFFGCFSLSVLGMKLLKSDMVFI